MNRMDFMNRLSALLSDLPENERREAITYYNDYLNDAGVENEGEVLAALGTPEELAASIREGLQDAQGQQGVFSEEGFRRETRARGNQLIARAAAGQGTAAETGRREAETDDRKRNGGASQAEGTKSGASAAARYRSASGQPALQPMDLILLIILAALALAAAFVIGIFFLIGIALVCVGLITLIASAAKLKAFPAAGLLSTGLSLMCIGIGILLTVGMGWAAAKLLPPILRKAAEEAGGHVSNKGK